MHRLILLLAVLALVAAACNDDDPTLEDPGADGEEAVDDDLAEGYDITDQPADAAARFVTPQDGDTVTSPVQVEMAADGVEIVPAGEPAVGEGHFHVLVDVGCVDDGTAVPSEEGYNHFGDGSTTTELELEPGTYELCLQLGDGTHLAFGETDVITVTVE